MTQPERPTDGLAAFCMDSPASYDIEVALVEDDPAQRAQLMALLGAAPSLQPVGAWGTLPEAVARLPDLMPQVVLVDIGLAEDSGIDLVRQLKGRMPQTQFMMLTVVKDTPKVFAALEAGATGYLLKKDAPTRLVAAIEDLVAGGSPMSSAIARQVVLAFQKPGPMEAGEAGGLSARERQVLDLLARGLLHKEIADALQIGLGTVRTYVRRIYEKLHARNRAEAVRRATTY